MKNKLRKPRKASNRLKKEKATQSVRQSVNIVVGLPQRSRRRQTTKMGGMRARGEPNMPSSVTASNPPKRNVEVTTTNRITEDKLKAIQDEARSESNVKLLELQNKVLAIEQQQSDTQEAQEDRITQAIEQGKKAIQQVKSPLQPRPDFKRVRGKDKSPRKKKGSIQTPQTEENQTIQTPQTEELKPFMDLDNDEEMSQDGS